ncbi:MAG: response regulator [Candidatus Kapaibacteriota bacterium]|jgi:two-component system chemotaxis response regulator CheY
MATNLSNKRVLIVDDSPTVQNFVAMSLKTKGFDTIKANNGEEALEKLKLVDVTLVITDMNMPEMDGITLVQRLRNSEDYKDVPIIILSSLTDQEYVNNGLQAGANSYFFKPFKPNELVEEVVQLLGLE